MNIHKFVDGEFKGDIGDKVIEIGSGYYKVPLTKEQTSGKIVQITGKNIDKSYITGGMPKIKLTD